MDNSIMSSVIWIKLQISHCANRKLNGFVCEVTAPETPHVFEFVDPLPIENFKTKLQKVKKKFVFLNKPSNQLLIVFRTSNFIQNSYKLLQQQSVEPIRLHHLLQPSGLYACVDVWTRTILWSDFLNYIKKHVSIYVPNVLQGGRFMLRIFSVLLLLCLY